jgi:hypothetical protein
MLRAILTATAVLCMSQAASRRNDAEQRSACMGDYEVLQGMPGGGRIIACSPGERQDHAGLQEGADGREKRRNEDARQQRRRPCRLRRSPRRSRRPQACCMVWTVVE